jgi:hypothetical protein
MSRAWSLECLRPMTNLQGVELSQTPVHNQIMKGVFLFG